jgi:hypothetical protein
MIDSGMYINDAQLDQAYGDDCLRAASLADRRVRLRRVAEFAIAAFVAAEHRSTAPALAQLAESVDRLTATIVEEANA